MAMSNVDTDRPDAPLTPAEAAQAVRQEARFGATFLRRHGWGLLLVFVGVLLPLWGFGALAEDLREGEAFAFDVPLLQLAQGMAGAGLDRFAVAVSALGYAWGVIPLDVALIAALVLRRRLREGLFAGIAIIGSALLNLGAKQTFARPRPGLWQSIAPETTYSFPSGHAMGAMTLACVVVLLCWGVRSRWGWHWRWPVTLIAATFVLLVGLSRVYLGVHYPSDILAGWAAALAWAVGVYALVFTGTLRPWQPRAPRPGA